MSSSRYAANAERDPQRRADPDHRHARCVDGPHSLVVVGSPPDRPGGRVRVARNDVALPEHDPDGDGAMNSRPPSEPCSVRAGIRGGFNCACAADARDTDGDGISDGWEVSGRRLYLRLSPPMFDYVPLPKWGADPRHKDLFVEVDFMLRCPRRDGAENDSSDRPYLRELLPGPDRLAHARTACRARRERQPLRAQLQAIPGQHPDRTRGPRPRPELADQP
jgi:hypothetical protein